MIQSSGNTDQNKKLLFWKQIWKQQRRKSKLKETQRLNPERWNVFYDRVSGLWNEITGSSDKLGNAIAGFIADSPMVSSGSSVLDIGCGPGTLSLALANKGFMVTALDNSEGMIRILEEKIQQNNVHGIKTLLMDWKQLPMVPNFDLTVACFFPDAFSPQGLYRMESVTIGHCLLVMGDGKEAFPLRKEIWKKIMDVPIPSGRFNLICAQNYLKASGRKPFVKKLKLPVCLDAEIKQIETYYREYFTIFNKSGPQVQQAITETLDSFKKHKRVQLDGVVHLNVLWWKPSTTRPILL